MHSVEAYLAANPFERVTVGENEIWAGDEEFLDVASINKPASDAFDADLERVNLIHECKARFLLGTAGLGKSHLMARLRRNLGNEHFLFAANPPNRASEIKRFVLGKVIQGLRRPVMERNRPRPFSQMERLVCTLLKYLPMYREMAAEDVHWNWQHVSRSQYDYMFSELIKRLEDAFHLALPHSMVKALFCVLDPERRHIAADWLAGSQSLSDADLERLGVGGPMEEPDIVEVMKLLGRLSVPAGPLVLVLDQLDSMTHRSQVEAFESLLIDLNDGGKNWYFILCMHVNLYATWVPQLNPPFFGRFGKYVDGNVQLNVTEMEEPTAQEKKEILRRRLKAERLKELRHREGFTNELYPFTEAILDEIVENSPANPRWLLQMASDRYISELIDNDTPLYLLRDVIEDTFTRERAELEGSELPVATASIADRVAELIEVMHFCETGAKPESQDGPLYESLRSFRGSDRVFAMAGRDVRIVCHDIQRTTAFPAVLTRLADSADNLVLVRDGRVPCTGKATAALLETFQRNKTFLHLTLDELKDLHALGRVLAKMRGGDFTDARTEPDPTPDNIMKCLSELSAVANSRIVSAVFEPKRDERDETDEGTDGTRTGGNDHDHDSSDDDPSKHTEPHDKDLEIAVADIMDREQWLSVKRLVMRLCDRGIGADEHVVTGVLRGEYLRERLRTYHLKSADTTHGGLVIRIREQ